MHGPVFANIVLADEINRAPPKTQAAMLEAMQEQNVTVVGKVFHLEPPFLVLATQNPIEQEGTYPLPEAQLDRFMFLIELEYPSEAEEIQIARTTTGEALPRLDHLMTPAEIIKHQSLVRRVPVPDHIYSYAARLVRKTRPERLDGSFVDQAARLLGCRPAGGPVLDSGCQGPRGPAGQLHGAPRRRSGGRRSRLDAPDHHHVRRPGRRNRFQEDRPAAGGRDGIVELVRCQWSVVRCFVVAAALRESLGTTVRAGKAAG